MTPAKRADLTSKLTAMRRAYTQLADGAHALLEEAPLFWTERLLLRLVRHPYRRRLPEIGAALPAAFKERGE